MRIDRDRVEQACPRLGEVQDRLDDAVARVDRERSNLSPSQRGTAIHMDLKRQIDSLNDPTFIAEKSFAKSGDQGVTYGLLGTVRVDVLENVDNKTVCVYHIKTGAERILPGRAAEIIGAIRKNFSYTSRILRTEIKPR